MPRLTAWGIVVGAGQANMPFRTPFPSHYSRMNRPRDDAAHDPHGSLTVPEPPTKRARLSVEPDEAQGLAMKTLAKEIEVEDDDLEEDVVEAEEGKRSDLYLDTVSLRKRIIQGLTNIAVGQSHDFGFRLREALLGVTEQHQHLRLPRLRQVLSRQGKVVVCVRSFHS